MLLEDKKILFIHIPKCAGTSIAKLLDWSVVWGDRHRPLQSYTEEYSEDFLESCFKFTIVRNPWDRMVSWYFYHKHPQYKVKTKEAFQSWVKEGMSTHWSLPGKIIGQRDWNNYDELSIIDFLNNDKNIDLDYIGKVEALDKDMEHICKKTNTKYKPLPKRNTSKRLHYTEYYDEETKNIVRNRFSRDLSLFPYEF